MKLSNSTPSGAHRMPSDQVQMLVFGLGDAEFGVPITQAVRIVRLSPITRVPRSPGFLEGVISVEGDIIPVVDLKKRFMLSQTPYGPKARLIIVETGDQLVGLLVDHVQEILPLPTDAVEPPPAMVADINGVYLSGIVQRADRLLVILDLGNVLTLEEVDALEAVSAEQEAFDGGTM